MRSILLFAFFSSLACTSFCQESLQLFDPAKKWALKKNKIEKNTIIFNEYNSEDLGINTMVWQFLPNGIITYDYESDESIYACAGVDFLDLDLTDSYYAFDPSSQVLTLQIKGGYAAIDDFIFKREYQVSMANEENDYGYKLTLIRELFYNNLKRFK